jgi:hypothetical protein
MYRKQSTPTHLYNKVRAKRIIKQKTKQLSQLPGEKKNRSDSYRSEYSNAFLVQTDQHVMIIGFLFWGAKRVQRPVHIVSGSLIKRFLTLGLISNISFGKTVLDGKKMVYNNIIALSYRRRQNYMARDSCAIHSLIFDRPR